MTRGAQQVELLMRLEGELDPDAETAWAEEIERRAHEARAGAPEAGDWETVCNEIEAELKTPSPFGRGMG
ncbi:MAG TPA: addiction module protein [Myxococcaceae bacterium]|jgi:hypothetical protein